LLGTLVAETILASVHVRARQQAGHMNASDLIRPPPNLARRGPSTYGGHHRTASNGFSYGCNLILIGSSLRKTLVVSTGIPDHTAGDIAAPSLCRPIQRLSLRPCGRGLLLGGCCNIHLTHRYLCLLKGEVQLVAPSDAFGQAGAVADGPSKWPVLRLELHGQMPGAAASCGNLGLVGPHAGPPNLREHGQALRATCTVQIVGLHMSCAIDLSALTISLYGGGVTCSLNHWPCLRLSIVGC